MFTYKPLSSLPPQIRPTIVGEYDSIARKAVEAANTPLQIPDFIRAYECLQREEIVAQIGKFMKVIPTAEANDALYLAVVIQLMKQTPSSLDQINNLEALMHQVDPTPASALDFYTTPVH